MLWSILTQNQCPLFDFDAKLICWTVCSVSTKNLTESETVSVKHNCQDWRCMQWEMVRAQTDVNSPNLCHFLGIYININPYIWFYICTKINPYLWIFSSLLFGFFMWFFLSQPYCLSVTFLTLNPGPWHTFYFLPHQFEHYVD